MSSKTSDTAKVQELDTDDLDVVVGGKSSGILAFRKDSGEAHLGDPKKKGNADAYYDGAGNHVRDKDSSGIILTEETETI